jgi:siroheme synthase
MMTLETLAATLNALLENGVDPETSIHVATQRTYPLAFTVSTVTPLDADSECCDGPDVQIVWIATGDHPNDPYAPRDAWNGCY